MAQTNTHVNRCQRCNRQLKDLRAQYGWRCAEILGVAQNLNYVGDGAYSAYIIGMNEANAFLKNNKIDAKNIDVVRFYESFAKMYLASGMYNQYLHNLAYDDMLIALTPRRNKNGNLIFERSKAPSVETMLDLKDVSDYLIGKYSTTAFTEAAFNYDIYLLQQMLNAKGVTDKFGNKLILDGIFGAKTQWARDTLTSKNKKDCIMYYKDLWADSSTLQGVGVLDNGEIIFGENTDKDLRKLAKLVHQQSITNDKLKFQKDIDIVSEAIASKTTFYADEKITAENKKKEYINKITNINYYTIEDVTKQMTGALLRAEYVNNMYTKYPWIITIYPTFFNKVKNGSSVDLKNQKPFKDKNLFIYNGEIVDQDALGNILYGYLGKVYGIPDLLLFMGAGYAQLKAGTWDWRWGSTFFDDPRDAKRVKQGIEIYKKFHEN